MATFDGAEITNLVEQYILDSLKRRTHPHNPTLYGDDSLTFSCHLTGHAMDRFREDMIKILKEFGLSITISTNLNYIRFLRWDLRFEQKQLLMT